MRRHYCYYYLGGNCSHKKELQDLFNYFVTSPLSKKKTIENFTNFDSTHKRARTHIQPSHTINISLISLPSHSSTTHFHFTNHKCLALCVWRWQYWGHQEAKLHQERKGFFNAHARRHLREKFNGVNSAKGFGELNVKHKIKVPFRMNKSIRSQLTVQIFWTFFKEIPRDNSKTKFIN